MTKDWVGIEKTCRKCEHNVLGKCYKLNITIVEPDHTSCKDFKLRRRVYHGKVL